MNEGNCDASWAFAVPALVEANAFIRTGTLKSLSTQELLDCAGSGSGCGGGSPISALRTVIAKGGLASTPLYPYTARQSLCRAAATPICRVITEPSRPREQHGLLPQWRDHGPTRMRTTF